MMTTDEMLNIIKTYGFVDVLFGFRMTSVDLYRNDGARAYMRCSDLEYADAVSKLYNRLYKTLFNTMCSVYNESLN